MSKQEAPPFSLGEYGQPNRVKKIELPIRNLLQAPDSESNSAYDSITVYKSTHPAGAEYDIFFPALTGHELYTRLLGISRVRAEMTAAITDYSMLLDHANPLLSKHQNGLGILWSTYYPSVRVHHGALLDELDGTVGHRGRVKKSLEATEQTINLLSELSQGITPEYFDSIDILAERLAGMLDGRLPSMKLLTDVFRLTPDDVFRVDQNDSNRSRTKVNRLLRNKGSKGEKRKILPLVIEAVRQKVAREGIDPSESIREFAANFVKPPKGQHVIQVDSDYYTIPQIHKDAPPFEQNDFVLQEGKAEPTSNVHDRLEARRQDLMMKSRPNTMVVPVVRIVKANNGTWSFVFNEVKESEPLSADILNAEKQRQDSLAICQKPFQNQWFSTMAGIEMLVATHSSIRNIEDPWNSIWGRERISYSEVLGDEKKEGERTQINGPVQSGIIALHSAVRYIDHFTPFVDNLEKIFES